MSTRIDTSKAPRLPVSKPIRGSSNNTRVLGERSASQQNSDAFSNDQGQKDKNSESASNKKAQNALVEPHAQKLKDVQTQKQPAFCAKATEVLKPLGVGQSRAKNFGSRWGRSMVLNEHASRHGPEFGLTMQGSSNAYASACAEFWEKPIPKPNAAHEQPDIVEKQGTQKGKENRLYRFERSTGIFSAVFVQEQTGKVTVCTYFKPRHGHHNQMAEAERYFLAQ